MDESQLVNRLEDDAISEIGPALEKFDTAGGHQQKENNNADESILFDKSEIGEQDHNTNQTLSLSPNREDMCAPRPARQT